MPDSRHIVCPHCAAINRLPTEKLTSSPNCGQCHRALFDGHPVELNEANFARHLERNDIPVLIDFWAPWCGPCRSMAPQFAEAARLLEPYVRVAKVNTESEQQLGARYGIRSIPTLKLFRQGKEVASQAGAMSVKILLDGCRRIIANHYSPCRRSQLLIISVTDCRTAAGISCRQYVSLRH